MNEKTDLYYKFLKLHEKMSKCCKKMGISLQDDWNEKYGIEITLRKPYTTECKRKNDIMYLENIEYAQCFISTSDLKKRSIFAIMRDFKGFLRMMF